MRSAAQRLRAAEVMVNLRMEGTWGLVGHRVITKEPGSCPAWRACGARVGSNCQHPAGECDVDIAGHLPDLH